MKRSKFTEAQIFNILKEGEAGMPVADILRKHAISQGTYYKWKSKYGGMQINDLKRLKALEEENFRLKRMFADVSLDNRLMKDLIEKKL